MIGIFKALEMWIFGNIDLKEGQKQPFRVQMGGGGCQQFESFVGNLGGFAPPPPPEKSESTPLVAWPVTTDCDHVNWSMQWKDFGQDIVKTLLLGAGGP